MSESKNIAQILAKKPKRSPKRKSLLLDLDKNPKALRWLERQAAKHQCSKTSYVEALIEQDRLRGEG